MTYLVIIWLVLAALDAAITIHQLKKLGIEVEMNPAIRKLCGWWGIPKGVVVGVMLPSTAVAALAAIFHLDLLLAVGVGMRTMLFIRQVFQLRAA